jgi:hypothetical protein
VSPYWYDSQGGSQIKQYIVYNKNTGKILRRGTTSSDSIDGQINDPAKEAVMEGNIRAISDITHQVEDGKIRVKTKEEKDKDSPPRNRNTPNGFRVVTNKEWNDLNARLLKLEES